jgi:hypothetical protein
LMPIWKCGLAEAAPSEYILLGCETTLIASR